LELQESAKRKAHFALFNRLVLGHAKYKGVQRVYCNPLPNEMFHGSHRMDTVIIRPPGVDNRALLYHLRQYGMLECCSCSLFLL
jgi:hypothetical protein